MVKYLLFLIGIFFSGQGNTTTFDEIQKLIANKNLDLAISRLKLENSLELTATELLILEADLYVATGSPSKAIDSYSTARFRSLSHTDRVDSGLASAYLALGEIQKARDYAVKALRANPDLISPRLIFISLEIMEGLPSIDQQYLDLLKSTNNDPLVWRDYLNYALQRDISLASELAKKAYVVLGDDPTILELAGQASFLVGDLKQGLDYFVKARRLFIEAGNFKQAEKVDRWLEVNSENNRGSVSRDEKNRTLRSSTTEIDKRTDHKEVHIREENDSLPDFQLNEVKSPDSITIDFTKPFRTGSGLILFEGGYVVTNRHVVEGWNKIQVRNGLGEMREANFVILDKEEDLALIELKSSFTKNLGLSFNQMRDPQPGEDVFLMGYPLVGIFGDVYPTISEGIVSKSFGFQEANNGFILTASMNPGNSGGPIFGADGSIVGLAVAKLDKQEFLENRGTLPEDVNSAIKSRSIKAFLKDELIRPHKVGMEAKPKNFDARSVYASNQGSVVLVVVEEK